MKANRILGRFGTRTYPRVAFTPKGGCPLKREQATAKAARLNTGVRVAFTPKGGCPLKQLYKQVRDALNHGVDP